MGRHETFDVGMPLSDQLLSGTAILAPDPIDDAHPDRRALVAYASWLHGERSHVCRELYPHLGWTASHFIVGQNAGFDYHRNNTPSPSTRALGILDAVGCDWRNDSYLGIGDEPSRRPEPAWQPHPDGRLLDLGREFFEAQAAHESAAAASKAAHEAFKERERPFEEMEHHLLMHPPRQLIRGGVALDFWQAKHIRQILGGRYVPATTRDAERVDSTPRAVFEKLLPLVEEREARREAVRQELRQDALDEEFESTMTAAEEAAQKVYRLRACTFEGLAVKARVLKANDDHYFRERQWHDANLEGHERAFAEITEAVEHLIAHGAAQVRTGTFTDPDLATVEDGIGVDLLMMAGGVVHDNGLVNYCDAGGRVLRKPVVDWISFWSMRLFAQAKREQARQTCNPDLDEAQRTELTAKLRRDLRIDALKILAFRSGEASDKAIEVEDDLPEIPVQPEPGAGTISPDLIRAVEAHREAVQLAIHDPIADKARSTAANRRIRALADAIRDTPARTPADLRHKVIYLWPGPLDEHVSIGEVADTFNSFRDDAERLAINSTSASEAVGG